VRAIPRRLLLGIFLTNESLGHRLVGLNSIARSRNSCVEEFMSFDRNFQPGDKAFLDFSKDPESSGFSEEAWKINKTIITVGRPVPGCTRPSGGCNSPVRGWFVEEADMWFKCTSFYSILVHVTATTDSMFCCCKTPSPKENWAGGDKFFICEGCKKEITSQ